MKARRRCDVWNKILSNRLAFVLLCSLTTGCASYVTPGRGADLEAVGVTQAMRDADTDGVIKQAFDRKPLASFPASIAVARIQSPGYCSSTATSYGQGRYSILTTRD